MRALLVGNKPQAALGCEYVTQPPYDGVVIGSLELSELLRFSKEPVLQALAEGKPVLLYEPGLPEAPRNRALAASLASAKRELKGWGIQFTSGGSRRLITAQQARLMRTSGERPGHEAVLTPLAREILEGTQ